MGYMNANKYLFNGTNYEDLPRETKIKLLEHLSKRHDMEGKPQCPHPEFDKKHLFTQKKMVVGTGVSHHEVSHDYKNLGYLHKDGRLEKYCEQDGPHDFTNMPTIFR